MRAGDGAPGIGGTLDRIEQAALKIVVETDIARCFTAIPHEKLPQAMCASRGRTEAALVRRPPPAGLGLEPKEAKPAVLHLEADGTGPDLLGFHQRRLRARGRRRGRGFAFLARRPSDRAMRHARGRPRRLTPRSRSWLPVEEVVRGMSLFLRGARTVRSGGSRRRNDLAKVNSGGTADRETGRR